MQHWRMSHVTRVNVSYRTYKWVKSLSVMNESSLSVSWMSQVPQCHEWVKSLSVTPNTSRRHHQTNHWFHELIPNVPLAPKKSSQHIHTREYVMSHMCMHRVSQCHTEWDLKVSSSKSFVNFTHMNDSCHIFGWVTFHRVTSSKSFLNITHMNDSCHTCGWVTFHSVTSIKYKSKASSK